jgi:hypothetical protein
MKTTLLEILTVFITIPYASLFEWLLHRYVMHRPILGFRYAYQAHAKIHHIIFQADQSYHLQKESDKWTIPMAWWNSLILVPLASSPFAFIGWALGSWAIPITAFVVIYAYYGTYEYLHWCMHLPRKRRLERSGIFFRLNGHHILHHRYMHKNFNVVLPLADLCLGTLLLRSKIPFRQVRGESVPDVQPKTPKD